MEIFHLQSDSGFIFKRLYVSNTGTQNQNLTRNSHLNPKKKKKKKKNCQPAVQATKMPKNTAIKNMIQQSYRKGGGTHVNHSIS